MTIHSKPENTVMGAAPNFEYIQTCATLMDMTTVAHRWSTRMYSLAEGTRSEDPRSALIVHVF